MSVEYFDFRFLVPFVVCVGLLIALKLYLKCTCGDFKSNRLMFGKTVIITGANKGIGKETALDLATRGARVILACRDLTRANAARDEIIRASTNQNVVVHQLDLSSLTSVKTFSKIILESEDRLDVLVNSAGVGGLRNAVSCDGFEAEMQTNYLGPFLLTNLLMPLLRKSSPSRIIFISSLAHHYGHINLENFNKWGQTNINCSFINGFVRYSTTKLANILNSNHLAQIMQGTGVTINSCHPGAVATDIQNGFKSLRFPIQLFMKWFCKSVKEGAQTGIFLAVSERVEGVSGKYFQDCKIAPLSKDAQDKILAAKLWVKTEEILENWEKPNMVFSRQCYNI